MKPTLDVFGLCRDYVFDNATWLGTKRTNWLTGLCRGKDFRRLAAISGEPRARIACARDFAFYLQVEAFFKKNAAFTDPVAARAAAEATFERGERICRITNRRLDYYYAHPDRLDRELLLLVERCVNHMQRVLGSYEIFLNQIPDLVRVTSGASATSPRSGSAPPLKLKTSICCYPGSVPYLKALSRLHGWQKGPRCIPKLWNRVEFVAKNWKTDRTIACEQEGSLPFQLAFDSYAKRRLRRVGIDLSDQSSNQRDALRGSLDGSLATIDMSMASDTVAYNTVAWLLPQPWFEYLCAHRAPLYSSKEGGYKRYAKFSSMGNGATFALETLIFYVMAKACGSKQTHVYGDDVTIETELVPQYLRLLRFFGFIPNEDKTCTRGPYRESCGHHYYSGVYITPFYLRSTDPWDAPNAAHNVNGLAAISEHGRVWDRLRAFTRASRLLLVPATELTTTGVHLHPYHAHQQNLFKFDRDLFQPRVKQYLVKGSKRSVNDVRALYLWYIRNSRWAENLPDMNRTALRPEQDTRSYTNELQRKYRRRWVGWEYPATGLQSWLFAFSAFLSE